MNEILFWIIISLVIIAIIWFIVFFISFSFANHFRNHLKTESASINVLLIERIATMFSFIEILKENKIKLNLKDVNFIKQMESIKDFQLLNKLERDEKILQFSHCSYNIVSMCESNVDKLNAAKYKNIVFRYKDIENIYRQQSALYNSDIIGFNYWIHIYSLRFVFRRIIKFTKKDLII